MTDPDDDLVETKCSCKGGTYDILDPNGDVVLIVSYPKGWPAYRCPSSVPPDSTQNSATGNTPKKRPSSTADRIGHSNKRCRLPDAKFKVSSKHLILASKYFEGRLKSCWSEGKSLEENGTIELDLPDSNPDVLMYLLDIFHLRTRRVPQSLSLGQLTEIGTLVDYFQCLEAVELYARMWIEKLEFSSDRIVNWIFVSWAFRDASIFEKATKSARASGTADMDTLYLPIPAKITSECRFQFHGFLLTYQGDIDNERSRLLEMVFGFLHKARQDLEDSNDCFECNSAFLGGFIKQMKTHGFHPCASRPFQGLSVNGVLESLQRFTSDKGLKRHGVYGCSARGYSTTVKAIIDKVSEEKEYTRGIHLLNYT